MADPLPGGLLINVWTPIIPGPLTTFWLAPLLALITLGYGGLCGWLKVRRNLRTGDTRKIFHFAIFTTAAVVALIFGVAGVNLLGGLLAGYIALVLRLGEGHPLYEALAREQDQPHRSLYIVLPFLATAFGGIAAAALFGPYAIVGIAVSGWGDAVAEPVGIRFGRHAYRVPNFGGGVRSRRSLEGSASVFIASLVAASVSLYLLLCVPGTSVSSLDASAGPSLLGLVLMSSAIALAAAVTEAVSHHGLDNFTLQLVAAGLAFALA